MGARSTPGRPRLLALVYGATLLLLGVTLVGLVAVVSSHITSAALNATAAADRSLVASSIAGQLTASDLADETDPARRSAVGRGLQTFLADHGMTAIAIVDSAGELRYAVGRSASGLADLAPSSSNDAVHASAAIAETNAPGLPAQLIVERLPLVAADGTVLGSVFVGRDAALTVAASSRAVFDTLAILAAGAAILALLLLLVFRAAQRLLDRRTTQLLEAARHDPLTGMLNHGAIFGLLAIELEEARRDAGWIIVAVVDIDGFRLLNETHGHAAGDGCLLVVADALQREAPEGAYVGRYGPDEFLLIGPPSCAPQVRPAIERVREHLAVSPLAFPGSEPLTISISAGVASYPEHAASVSELLSAATATLVEAKTGGGNRVRVDAPDEEEPAARWRGFDVVQSLVVAVDAKDHYTKRHSEEVARYAVFLAEQLGTDAAFRREVRVAGLLHDVGKIGVPDLILRKPAPLTAEEKDVMAQHAVVGNLIVASLPGMELVASGVRGHHERWDGSGYPDGLIGDAIPHIARIVAVADAFSAMTTSRPYRSALPLDEALARIEHAAGTHLDPKLTDLFVAALRAMPAERVPYDDRPATRLWLLDDEVA
jgi:diguanylate cyclase (GGDEF)-like protein/putative nucleotidyltransferase with HDIG domain